MRTKFLWVEDNATTDLKSMLVPVLNDGRFEPVIAVTVADGLHRLWENEYAAIILDIRLPPGNNLRWAELYNSFGQKKHAGQLGFELLKSLLSEPDSEIKLSKRPKWLKPSIFGVLTVENDPTIKEFLSARGIPHEQKTVRASARTLLNMVERITRGRD